MANNIEENDTVPFSSVTVTELGISLVCNAVVIYGLSALCDTYGVILPAGATHEKAQLTAVVCELGFFAWNTLSAQDNDQSENLPVLRI